MADPRPCALARRWWGRPCERCGVIRQFRGEVVPSVKCEGVLRFATMLEDDLAAWHRLGGTHLQEAK